MEKPEIAPIELSHDAVLNESEILEGLLTDDYEKTVSKMNLPKFYIFSDPPVEEKIILDFINQKFQIEILKMALIKSIQLRFDEVNVQMSEKNPLSIQKGEYYLPLEEFRKYWKLLNKKQKEYFSNHIYRAEAFGNWYTEGHTQGNFFPSPIAIFNQDYDTSNKSILENEDLRESGLNYLQDIPNEKRREKYILGTIAHEIGHNIYAYLIFGWDTEQKWKEIIDKNGNVSKYAEKYYKENGKIDYDENFAEAVRIYTTNAVFLKTNFSEIYEFIKNDFPEIQEG